MKDWIREATASDAAEVERLHPALPPPILEGVREDSASTDEELTAFMRRLRRVPSTAPAFGGRPLLPWALGGGALLLGAVAVAAVTLVPVVEPPPVQVAALHLEPGVSHAVNDSITVSGLGDLTVDRLHDRGADLSLVDGVARFEVDPTGSDRALRVSAADVDVRVMGTVFTVQRRGDEVSVDVLRGRVAVARGDWTGELGAGESWSTTDAVVDARLPATAPPEAPEVAGEARPAPVEASAPAAPTAVARPPAAGSGRAQADPTDGASDADLAPPGACLEDPFSLACRQERRAEVAEASPEQRYRALRRAIARVGQDPAGDRRIVDDCNTFLSQHADTAFADDVRAWRVQAAFHGDRASQVVKYADSFLVTASADHPERAAVERAKRIAGLRQAALDSAQTGACDDALPLLRDLVDLEAGVRRHEALAWTGLCSLQAGDPVGAERILSQVDGADLSPGLRSRVQRAWMTIRPDAVDPEVVRDGR